MRGKIGIVEKRGEGKGGEYDLNTLKNGKPYR
jgi:hypothetical protein